MFYLYLVLSAALIPILNNFFEILRQAIFLVACARTVYRFLFGVCYSAPYCYLHLDCHGER